MEKVVLLSLVSRQSMANIIPAVQLNPHRVVLITSKNELSTAKNICKVISSMGISCVLSEKQVDPFDVDSTTSAVMYENTQLRTDESPVLNITAGTKLMALGAYRVFLERGAKTIYCDTTNHLIHTIAPKSEKPTPFNVRLTVRQYLEAHGYSLRGSEQIRLHDDYRVFLSTAVLPRALDFERVQIEFRRRGCIDKPHARLEKYDFIIEKNYDKLILRDKKTGIEARFTTQSYKHGNFLEDLTYIVVESQKPDNVVLSGKISSVTGIGNEIDVLFTKNAQLGLISCKSGQVDKEDLFELEGLRQLAGGTFGIAYFVMPSDVEPSVRKRAREYGIIPLGPNDLRTFQFIAEAIPTDT